MSYEKQNFESGQILTAAQLNHMEAGIEAAAKGEGLSELAKFALLCLLDNAVYTTDTMKSTLTILRSELTKKSDPAEIPVQSVSLSATTLTMNEGETTTLTITVLPANHTHAVFSSISPGGFVGFVTTDESTNHPAPGVYVRTLKALKAGAVTFRASVGDKEASCAVTVKAAEPKIPVESVTVSPTTLTMTEGETKTLTLTALPANASPAASGLSYSQSGIVTANADGPESSSPNVDVWTLKALKAGTCIITAWVDDKEASCTVTVKAGEAETAQLIYDLPSETALSTGFDTGLKLLEHATTETPQYTILLDLKPSDNYEATEWTQVVHCMTETGYSWSTSGINIGINPNNGTLRFVYYNQAELSLCDTITHFKMRTRYVIQLDGKKYRGGSTHCTLSGWNTATKTVFDVPESMIIGGAREQNSTNIVRCLDGTLYQCKVYKGLLSDEKVNKFIQEGTV